MKNKRFVLSIIALLLMSMLVTNVAFATNGKNVKITYSDVSPEHWAYAAIMDMTSRGMFNGTSASDDGTATFSPNDDMTRAQFIAVLTRYLYSEQLKEMQPGETWFSNNYLLALKHGLLTGNELDNGFLTVACSRQEMSMLLVRAAYAGAGETADLLLPSSNIPDYDRVDEYYKPYVLQAYSMGFLAGVDNIGTFNPEGHLNRAQAATVIYRLLDPSARIEISFPEYDTYTWDDGVSYTGQVKNGEANGYGKMEFPEIGTYVGYFVNGKREGLGTFTWLRGDTYVGFWNADKMTGSGTYTFFDGETISGIWENNQISAEALYMSPSSLVMSVGETDQIVAIVEPDQITETITWSCSNENVASISYEDNLCTITAKTAGVVTITASTDSGKTATCELTTRDALVPLKKIALNYGDYRAKIGDSIQLEAQITPDNATNAKITWSSSNPSVATVSASGFVTAKAKGLAIISAKADSGLIATCYVVVEGSGNDTWSDSWTMYRAAANGQKTSSISSGTCTFNISNMTATLSASPYTGKYIDLNPIGDYEMAGLFESGNYAYEIYFTCIRDDLIIMEEKVILDGSAYSDYVQINYYALERQ